MAQGGKGKKVLSLLDKKDASNAAQSAIRREAEEANSMVDKMASLQSRELKESMSKKKRSMTSKMKATINKLLRKTKLKKKRTTLHPIIGATMKFHTDDDVVPAAGGSTGT